MDKVKVILGVIGAHLAEIREDSEFAAKTSKGTGLRYAETVLAELFDQAVSVAEDEATNRSV